MEKVSIATESVGSCFIAWSNLELVEGYGYKIPLYANVTELQETAVRLSIGKNPNGIPCDIKEYPIFNINGIIYIPGRLIPPSDEDLVLNMKNNEKKKRISTLAEIKSLIDNFRYSQDSVTETTEMVNKLKYLAKAL